MISFFYNRYFYILILLVLVSGAVGDELIHVFSVAAIFVALLTCFYFVYKRSYSWAALAIIYVSVFVFLFVSVKYGIVLEDRFTGGGDFDSAGTATLKFSAKCLIISAFFPIQEKLEAGIAELCKFALIYAGSQAILTSVAVNILGVPTNAINYLFPLIGGVADWEPSPLYVLAPSLDFTYFRPRFIFREPQGLGYFIMLMYFIYAMLSRSISKCVIIFAFFVLLVILAKAALIVFTVYMITYWTATKLENNRSMLFISIVTSTAIFLSIVYSFLGGYIVSRVSSIFSYDFSNFSFLPLGINSGLWFGFNDGGSVDISYFTIFYEMGVILGAVYLTSLLYIFFKINRTRGSVFICLFPIYVSFLAFLASGSTYSSGGAILIMYYLHVLASRFRVKDQLMAGRKD